MMSLELLTPGERGEITEVRHCGGCHGHGHENKHGHHKQKATAIGCPPSSA